MSPPLRHAHRGGEFDVVYADFTGLTDYSIFYGVQRLVNLLMMSRRDSIATVQKLCRASLIFNLMTAIALARILKRCSLRIAVDSGRHAPFDGVTPVLYRAYPARCYGIYRCYSEYNLLH